MIINYTKGNNSFDFFKPAEIVNENIFTVIVGKNGSGKSRLLNELLKSLIKEKEARYLLRSRDLGLSESKIGKISLTKTPSKLIAVSTSPYDKFPIYNVYSQRENHNSNYNYLGLRDLRTLNFGLAFMSRIISMLLKVVLYKPEQYRNITQVLNYLNYSDEIEISIELRSTRSEFRNLINLKTNEEFTNFYKNLSFSPIRRFAKDENNEIDIKKIKKLKEIFLKYNLLDNDKAQFTIHKNGIDSSIELEDLILLIDSNFIRLRDIFLKKNNSSKKYKINEASSGEQCIFTTFLGIACHIEENSLIFIDEPEISLHPEWQEKFISLLISTFSYYKECHFIIATHSPQLISKLSSNNCYVLQMDEKLLINAKEFIHNSVDFQLANLFNSPGFKNEYLSRISFSIMSKVAKNKKFDAEDILNFEIISSQIKYMDSNDPILKIFILIKDLKKKYA